LFQTGLYLDAFSTVLNTIEEEFILVHPELFWVDLAVRYLLILKKYLFVKVK
jgi:hypothetical protein